MVVIAASVIAILAWVAALPVGMFCLEVIAACLFFSSKGSPILGKHARARVAVLVPARNEAATISLTLTDIAAQLRPDDRLVVIADNCADETAAVARSLQAEAIERHDAERVGKGYAIDFGLRHLEADPPDVVIIIDADCRLGEHAIDYLASTCSLTCSPVQALYLMSAPKEAVINKRIATFAWRMKNWVRPLGLQKLGLPCQLTGSGMAFPWGVIRSMDMASGSIVEDLELGLDLTAAGHPPVFCPSARVASQFPTSEVAGDVQRRRWERGHIGIILGSAPRYLIKAVATGNYKLFGLTLDLAVPPLALLELILLLNFAVAGLAAVVGLEIAPFLVISACFVASATVTMLAWIKYGRDVLSPRHFVTLPAYVFSKVGLYAQMLFDRQSPKWIRTDRTVEK
jgi:cellulose synthase/poly-beta-1,6-N-acetylglucosamine synthase-like glycosyltransferase